MPLTAANFIPQGPIKSADLLEFFNVLTGAMTDQPIILANTLTLGGSQGAGSAPLRIGGVTTQTANMIELRTLAADAQPAFSVDKAGKISWGPGGGVGVDTSLARTGVAAALFTGALTVSAGLIVTAGGLNVQAGAISLGAVLSKSAAYVMVAADCGSLVVQSSANSVTLPAASAVPSGTIAEIKATINGASVARAGSDTIWSVQSGVTSITLNAGEHLRLRSDGAAVWYLT